MDAIHLRLPRDLVIGAGAATALPDRLAGEERVLVVATRHVPIGTALVGEPDRMVVLTWSGEPSVDTIENLARASAGFDPTVVVGIGGGSVLDAAKALAAAIPNRDGPLIDHLEVVGRGLALTADPLPVVAVPTTAGTGSEMTRNAVLDVPAAKRKVSLRHQGLVPRSVIVDPDLARSVPPAVASACALDAAVQLVESYATPMANPVSDLWASSGAQQGLATAARVIEGRADDDDRLRMAMAALCSGAALATAKLGTVHGFAGVVGGATGMGHGQLCGLFAGPVLRLTIDRLSADDPDHPSLARYAELARLADPTASGPLDLAGWFDRLADAAGLDPAPLASLDAEGRRAVVTATAVASSTAGNPATLSDDELAEVLATVASR